MGHYLGEGPGLFPGPEYPGLVDRMANLTDDQWTQVAGLTLTGQLCMMDFWDQLPRLKGVFCNATWDNFHCWKATAANTTVYAPCPEVFFLTVPLDYLANRTGLMGHRTCNEFGEWSQGVVTDWTTCIDFIQGVVGTMINNTQEEPQELVTSVYPPPQEVPHELPRQKPSSFTKALTLAYIYFVGGILSCLLLVVTLFIFSYFKTLQCNRISIHKNLVVSFIVRSILAVVMFEPYVVGSTSSYRSVDWLCKAVTALLQYSTIANIFWMFVEGLFLHNRVAVSVFSTEAPFRVFYVVGWGMPGVVVLVWSICMHAFNHNPCWNHYFRMPYIWMIISPIILAFVINAIFLVNIIRILITKLRANNTMETDQVRKAVKATAVLFPLLGMTNLLFFIQPTQGGAWEYMYRITNAVLQSSQGIFVSVIYCFMNGEVRSAIVKKYVRYKAARLGTNRGRRRSSRTSSLVLSSSDVRRHSNKHIQEPPATVVALLPGSSSKNCNVTRAQTRQAAQSPPRQSL